METEENILLPLDAATKEALQRRAAANGRATRREAQRIIMEAVGTARGDARAAREEGGEK